MIFRCTCGAKATLGFGKEASPHDPVVIPFRDYCDACFAREHAQRVARMNRAANVAQDYLDEREGT